jgi:hypothetical protein
VVEPAAGTSLVTAAAGAADNMKAAVRRATDVRGMAHSQLMERQDSLARGAGMVGFAAAGGLTGTLRLVTLGALGRPAVPRYMRSIRPGRNNMGPALVTLAAANQQLIGAVYGRRGSFLRRVSLLGVAAAGIAVATADEKQRQALLEHGQALLTPALKHGEEILERTGVLDKVLGV